MKKSLLSVTCLLATLLLASVSHAKGDGTLVVENKTKLAIWATVYSSSSGRINIKNVGCVLPGQSVTRASRDDGTWVLLEVKNEADTCRNHNNRKTFEGRVGAKIVAYQTSNGLLSVNF